MMFFIIITSIAVYYVYVISWIWGWINIKNPAITDVDFKVSLIIPCRNEEQNIEKLLSCIDKQIFDFKNLEVIIVDDHSSDDTMEVIKNYELEISNFKPLIIHLSENEQGKKAAIKKAIDFSKGEIIVCTDADCKFGDSWLRTMVSQFHSSQINMVTGPVMFFERPRFWNNLMQLEFLSLIAIGAASVQNGNPNMCNGANIAYRKTIFNEVEGFKGNEHIPSGDDEFLMQKINNKFRGSISFIKNHKAIVHTKAPNSLNEFINQRLRWASKSGHYSNVFSKIMPSFIFLFNTLLFFTPLLYFIGISPVILICLWGGKLLIELVFYTIILKFFRNTNKLYYLIPAQIFHVVYITIIGVLSVFVKYQWKGRRFSVK